MSSDDKASDKTTVKASDKPADRPADPRDRTPAKDNTPYEKADTSKTDLDRVEAERIADNPRAAAQRTAEEQRQAGAADSAGESADPDVHKLLAERQALELNRAELAPTSEDKDAVKEIDKQIAVVDKALAEHGYQQ